MLRRRTLACSIVLLASACGGGFHRMPSRPVLWDDPDRALFAPRPPERYVSWRFDALDQLFFRPVSEVWSFATDSEAVNVNAFDEVPTSSWFQNRIGRFDMTADAVARGACDSSAEEVPFPWTVVAGKPNGTNPGFTIEDANGTRYLLKTDGLLQPERASAADAIAATLLHAAGYFVPCNAVVFFDRDDLRLAPDATAELLDGSEIPLTQEHVEIVLAAAARAPDGRHRAAVSRFIEGEPIGPWGYEGTVLGDPNDVVPHTRRRDLRGLYVLFAWIGHIDARQENTLGAWITSGSLGYVRHYLIDFGDCFGVLHPSEAIARRFEHDHYLNAGTVIADYLTAGLVDRPWYHAELGPAGRTLGFYDAERFEPDAWAPGYPNPAFDAHTEHDAAWMARIIARFDPEDVRAAVSVGRFSDPIVTRELVRVLLERRRRILERYLTRLSPLAWPQVEGRSICLDDLAIQSGIRATSDRVYEASLAAWEPPREGAVRPPVRASADGRPCVLVPDGPLRYAAIDVVARTVDRERTLPLRLHAYGTRGGAIEVVGLERLGREDAR